MTLGGAEWSANRWHKRGNSNEKTQQNKREMTERMTRTSLPLGSDSTTEAPLGKSACWPAPPLAADQSQASISMPQGFPSQNPSRHPLLMFPPYPPLFPSPFCAHLLPLFRPLVIFHPIVIFSPGYSLFASLVTTHSPRFLQPFPYPPPLPLPPFSTPSPGPLVFSPSASSFHSSALASHSFAGH